MSRYRISRLAAQQMVGVPRAAQRRCSAACPTQQTLVFERFFDESGGMQLVIHAPFGARINRACGLRAAQALLPRIQFRAAGRAPPRTRSCCRSGETHSFALEDVARFLSSRRSRSRTGAGGARCAACSRRAGAGMRASRSRSGDSRGGKRTPGAAAADGGGGSDRGRVSGPDRVRRESARANAKFPITRWFRQTLDDCLHEAMDIDGLQSRCCGQSRTAKVSVVHARSAAAVAAGAGNTHGTPLRLSRRCAARGAAHAGGGLATLARSAIRCRFRQAGSPGNRHRSRRSLAGGGRTPMNCTMR